MENNKNMSVVPKLHHRIKMLKAIRGDGSMSETLQHLYDSYAVASGIKCANCGNEFVFDFDRKKFIPCAYCTKDSPTQQDGDETKWETKNNQQETNQNTKYDSEQ